MLELTDRHFRYLLRQLTRHTLLYTEMITAQALLHGDVERLLRRHVSEGPVAVQLAGSDPTQLAAAAELAMEFRYDEVNLNVGCPSDRVKSGGFGACLMADPVLVSELVAAVRGAVPVPVTVKHRIGIDDLDDYPRLRRFVDIVAAADSDGPKADSFIMHARKAWLQGLSPKENRTIPPLRYEEVYRLKAEQPHLTVELNGGVKDLSGAEGHLRYVDGVMIGRALYEDPLSFTGADALIAAHGGPTNGGFRAGGELPTTGRKVVLALLPYIEGELAEGAPFRSVTRHLLNLFKGSPGARAWRRGLSEAALNPAAGPADVERALAQLPDTALDAPLTQPRALGNAAR